MTYAGNFEGKTILNIPQEPASFAHEQGIPLPQLEDMVNQAKQTLLDIREERVHPLLDDKVLASWNGLMLPQLRRGRGGPGPGRLPAGRG